MPDIREVAEDVNGIIRRPGKIESLAQRKRKLAEVKPVKKLPTTHTITCGDFRTLEIKPKSVDLILTDVVCRRRRIDVGDEVAIAAV